MWRRLLHLLRDPDGRRDEKSNSFVVFIVALPIIIGMFGLGVDVARNVYIRSTLENAIDNAVYGGLTDYTMVQVNGSGHPALNPTALDEVERVYAMNRADGPGLSCSGSGNVPGTSMTKCWQQPRPASLRDTNGDGYNDTICYWVSERSRNAFLPVLSASFEYQTYKLSSGATQNADKRVSCN